MHSPHKSPNTAGPRTNDKADDQKIRLSYGLARIKLVATCESGMHHCYAAGMQIVDISCDVVCANEKPPRGAVKIYYGVALHQRIRHASSMRILVPSMGHFAGLVEPQHPRCRERDVLLIRGQCRPLPFERIKAGLSRFAPHPPNS